MKTGVKAGVGICCCFSLIFLVMMILVGFAVDHIFGKGIRDIAIYDPSTDKGSKLVGEEVCTLQKTDAFMWKLTNWEALRTGASKTLKPRFEEIGPFNFSREVCIFDREYLDGVTPPAVRYRKYHRAWTVESKPWDGSPGIDVNAKHHFINPAYISVMETLIRRSGHTLTGEQAERSFHASIISGALSQIINGLLAPAPDGFLESTYIGSIPSVMSTVVDTFDNYTAKVSFLPMITPMSKLRFAAYLWARPKECGDYSMEFLGCQTFGALGSFFNQGLDLDMVGTTVYDGFELGTDFEGSGIAESDLPASTTFKLWDDKRTDGLRNIDGIVAWNVSIADPVKADALQKEFGLTDRDMKMIHHWIVRMSTKVTPGLVAEKLLGKGYGKNDVKLLVWEQFASGTVTKQRGNRDDGLPKTLNDVNEKIPITFEISHWARTAGQVKTPVFSPQHLQYIFTGQSIYEPFKGKTNSKPLFTDVHMQYFLELGIDLKGADVAKRNAAVAECNKHWELSLTEAINLYTYLGWLMNILLTETGPVVEATAKDIMIDRDDPLLKILVRAGQLDSSRSGILYSAGEFASKEEARASDFELPQRVWDGTTEGGAFALTDEVPEAYLTSLKREKFATLDEKGKPVLLGPAIDVWSAPTVVEGYSGERFHMPVQESDVLKVWNDNLARAVTWTKTGEDTLEDIDTWVFDLEPSNLDTSDLYHQSIRGLFNISGLKTADVYISLPRFQDVDTATLDNIVWTPSAAALECCKTWRLHVEPDSGVTMGKDVVTQINFGVPGFGAFQDFYLPAGIMPLVWTQDRVVIGEEDAEKFKSGQGLASSARNFGFIGGPILFLLCLACMIGAIVRFKDDDGDGNFREMDERQFD